MSSVSRALTARSAFPHAASYGPEDVIPNSEKHSVWNAKRADRDAENTSDRDESNAIVLTSEKRHDAASETSDADDEVANQRRVT
jgi:hypothetical protein